MSETTPDRPKKIELSATQVIGGALAAMTAAALGSRLGVAGTVIGAALASVIAAVGGSLYTASIRASRERVRTVLVRTPSADPRPGRIRPRFTRRTARNAGIAALAAFAVAAVVVTTFEAATGQTLSGDDGTTVGQVSRDVGGSGGGSGGGSPTTGTEDRSATPAPEPSSSATDEPSATPSDSGTPSADPSASETPSASSEPTTPAPSTSASPEAAADQADQSSGTQ